MTWYRYHNSTILFTELDCPRYHTYIFNGEAHCTDGNKFGSICKYECNKGYERISGSASAQCLADQTWDADKTGCERVECDRYDEIMIKVWFYVTQCKTWTDYSIIKLQKAVFMI